MNKKEHYLAFSDTIKIIGINPYVIPPQNILKALFLQAGKDKSPISIEGTINDFSFIQTLVKYKEKWRLYLNNPMREATNLSVGDIADLKIRFDPKPRIILMHPRLKSALENNTEAKVKFDSLTPSLQKEIIRYISFLKTEEAITRNCQKAVNFLLGNERFIGRDKP